MISEGRDIKPHEIVVFTSCEIGEGENSFAQRFSALLKENIVVASNVTVSSSNVKISSLDSDGVLVRNNEGKPKVDGYVMDFCSNDEGFFYVFRNGERIDNRTIFGDKNPPKCIYGSNSVFSTPYFSDLERYERNETIKEFEITVLRLFRTKAGRKFYNGLPDEKKIRIYKILRNVNSRLLSLSEFQKDIYKNID